MPKLKTLVCQSHWISHNNFSCEKYFSTLDDCLQLNFLEHSAESFMNLNFDLFLLQVDLEHGNSCYLPNWPLCAFWTAFLRTSTHSQPLRPNIDVVSLSVNTPRMQVILVGRWHKKLGIFPFMSRLLETHQVEF